MSDGEADSVTAAGFVSRPPRWWLDIRWITAGVVFLTTTFILWGLFGPEPALRISRETTVVVEPLDDDGLPDYPAAILAMAGPAPPPEENAAVLVLQTLGPMSMKPYEISVACAALGIPPELPGPLLKEPGSDAATMVSHREFQAATERPWTGADLPALEAWLHRETADTTLALALLAKPSLTRDLLVQIRRDLEALGPPRSAADAVMSDRLATIDAVLHIFRRAPGGRGGRVEEFKQWTFKKESGWFLWTRLDWNEILKVMNDDYERIEAALRLPTFAERKSTLQGIQAGFRRDTDHWKQGNHRAMILVSLEYRSRFAAVKIRDALMSEQVSFLDLATRSHAGFELSRTAVALAEWRLDHEPDGPWVAARNAGGATSGGLLPMPDQPFRLSSHPFVR